MNVLYISNDGLTDPLGRSQIIPYLQGLSKKYKVHVIACEKKPALSKNYEIIESILQQSGITWHIVNYRNKPPVISSWFMQRSILRKAVTLIKREKISIIHCRSYPAAITGLYLYKRFKIPFIFDMRGFWADERVDRKIWNISNPVYYLIYRYFKRKEKSLFKNSSHIITLTHKAKEILINSFNISAGKISVVPCAVDLSLFKPVTDTEITDKYREKLSINTSDKLLVYVGSLGSCYLLREMLLFYKAGKEINKNLKFAFFSPVHYHEQIMTAAAQAGLEKEDIICRFLSREEMPVYLSIADYSVMFFEETFSIQGSSPTKHGELLSMHIPVVVNENVGDLNSIIEERNTGYIVKEFSETEFQEAWHYLINSDFNNTDFDFVAEKHYSLKIAIDSLLRIYSS